MIDVLKPLIAAVVALGFIPSAQADVLAVATNENSQSIRTNTEPGDLVRLNSRGETDLDFFTTANNQNVVLTFNSTCAVIGQLGSYVSIRIVVDGVNAKPDSG